MKSVYEFEWTDLQVVLISIIGATGLVVWVGGIFYLLTKLLS